MGELFSLKSDRPIIENVNRSENKIICATYLEELFAGRANGRTLVWMDETNFNLYCRRREGHSKISARADVVLPASRGANFHCIGPMTSSKMVLFITHRSVFKSQGCCAWFGHLIDAFICCKRHSTANTHNRLCLCSCQIWQLGGRIWRCATTPIGSLLLLVEYHRTRSELIQEPR